VHCVRLAQGRPWFTSAIATVDRVQVFHQDGKFVKEGLISPKTLGTGTAFRSRLHSGSAIIFTSRTETNHKIWIMQRDSMENRRIVRPSWDIMPASFRNVHAVAVDSKGNLFTTEASENKRVQKFVPAKGVEARRAAKI